MGGLYINGLVISIDEDKEKLLGDALAKLQPIFKESAECIGEKLFILNSTSRNCFSFDLAVRLSKPRLAILEM